ncbi:MAG: hypothetical protein U1F77_00945 [Kiritimatiellia bacterium]
MSGSVVGRVALPFWASFGDKFAVEAMSDAMQVGEWVEVFVSLIEA